MNNWFHLRAALHLLVVRPVPDRRLIRQNEPETPRDIMSSQLKQSQEEDFQIGPYRIAAELARGRVSRVLKAEAPGRKQPVAIKILNRDLPDPAEAVRWLERETAWAGRLDHPNIARILDCGVTDEGKPYLVMEYIEGVSLDRLILRKAALPFSALIDLALQTCRGLEAAARKNIVHLDIKPANLMVETTTRRVKIVDFGLARQLWKPPSRTAGSAAPASGPGAGIEGTPRYMSPEQCRGVGADHRSDIYSAGASFYHLFTSQRPFDSSTDTELIERIPPPPLIPIHEIHPEIPIAVCVIIERMMAPDPNDRYQDYETLISDLEAAKLAEIARESKTQTPGEKTGPAKPVPVAIPPEPAPPNGAWRWVQRHPALFASGAVLLFLLLLSLIFRPSDEENSEGEKRSLGPVSALLKKALVPEDSPEVAAAGKNRFRMRRLAQAAKSYREEKNAPPVSVDQLERAGLILPGNSLDAWDRPLTLVSERAAVFSLGADGLPDTGDEWEITFDGRFTRTPETPAPAAPDDASESTEREPAPEPENAPF